MSLGTRPVLLPELQQRAPVSVMLDGPTVGSGDSMCSGIMAYSYSSATLTHFQLKTNLRGVVNYVFVSDAKLFEVILELLRRCCEESNLSWSDSFSFCVELFR